MKHYFKIISIILSIPLLVGFTTFAFSDVTIGGGPSASVLKFLEPSGNGLNFSEIKAQAQTANITYTLPSVLGAAGTVLTDSAGTGTLSWTTPPGSSQTKSYSEIWYSNEADANITITSAGSYYPLPLSTVTVGTQDSNGLAVGNATANTITIGTGGSGVYEVVGTASLSGPNGAVLRFGVAKNGIIQLNIAGVATQESTSTHRTHVNFSGLLSLADGDILDARFSSNTNGDLVRVYHMNLFVHRIN